jgi:isopentenyl-diphosphate delta-isomerase
MDYQWVDLATMLSALAATPWAFSPWMVLEAENRDARQALTDFVARLRG